MLQESPVWTVAEAHAPAFFFFFLNKEPHYHITPSQPSRSVVDMWFGPFWKQPSYEGEHDWLTHLEKHSQQTLPPYFTQNKKPRECLSLSRVQFRVYLHLPSQHLLLT